MFQLNRRKGTNMRKLTFSASFIILALMVVTGARGFAGREAGLADLLEIFPDGGVFAFLNFLKLMGRRWGASFGVQQKLAYFLNKAQYEIAILGTNLIDV